MAKGDFDVPAQDEAGEGGAEPEVESLEMGDVDAEDEEPTARPDSIRFDPLPLEFASPPDSISLPGS